MGVLLKILLVAVRSFRQRRPSKLVGALICLAFATAFKEAWTRFPAALWLVPFVLDVLLILAVACLVVGGIVMLAFFIWENRPR